MQHEIEKIKQDLDEHLSAINDNSGEIQALFDYVQEVETKLDKLASRLDILQLSQPEKIIIQPLNLLEKKIFLILYTEQHPLTFQEIANKAQIPSAIVPECISSLSQKGIPLKRSVFKNQFFLALEKNFKEMQAKENIVNLSLNSFIEG